MVGRSMQLVAEIGVSWVTFGPDKQTKLALRASRRLKAAAKSWTDSRSEPPGLARSPA